MLAGFGEQPAVHIVDVATKSVTKTVALPAANGELLIALQDIAVSPDGAKIYATNSFDNVIHTVDLATYEASTFPISGEFPLIRDTSRGVINATGVTVSQDGKYLLVVHIVEKHLYRVSLDPATLGKAQLIDTAPYNVSGNGIWLGADNELLEVAGDELRVFRFKMNADSTKGDYEAKYQSEAFEQGLTYAVSHGDRLLVLNGSGAGAGGLPDGGFPAGGGPLQGDGGADDGGGLDAGGGGVPPFGDGGGFPQGGGGSGGTKKLPIKVLQLPR